jgi:sugar phosphate isomerase/epimerase
MRIGLLTECLPSLSLEEIAAWAGDAGFQSLEIAAGLAGGTADNTLHVAHIDVATLTPAMADEAREMLAERGLEVSSLACYENNLHPDRAHRERVARHLRSCINAAALLGAPTVGTFIGRDPSASVRENLDEAAQLFPALAQEAASRGVKLVIENCLMQGWHPDGYPGNLAYSPELWEWLSELGLYLNFDPSHLPPLGIDPIAALSSHLDRVAHVHAKDVECWPEQRNRFGFLGPAVDRTDPWDGGWWRYRLPGLGELDWGAITTVLADGGFEGAVSVEHEDPEWEGSQQQVQEGLAIAHGTLARALEDRVGCQ